MNPALKELPDDIDALKAMVVAMAEKAARAEALEADVSGLTAANADLAALNAAADERIARLTSIIKMFERARYPAGLLLGPTAAIVSIFEPEDQEAFEKEVLVLWMVRPFRSWERLRSVADRILDGDIARRTALVWSRKRIPPMTQRAMTSEQRARR